MLSDGARKQLYRALELFLVPPEDSQIEEHLPEPEMEFRRIRAAVQPPKHLDGLLVLSFRLPGRSLRLVYPAAKIVRMGDLEPQRRHRFGQHFELLYRLTIQPARQIQLTDLLEKNSQVVVEARQLQFVFPALRVFLNQRFVGANRLLVKPSRFLRLARPSQQPRQ